MANESQIRQALHTYFGFDTFKSEQLRIISTLLDGKDVFVLMPTGAGKSLCYQLPAMMSSGTAIIISPLIALMKNQVDSIRHYREDNSVAHFLNSTLTKAAAQQVRRDVESGRTKILYVAPESLTRPDNIEFLKGIKISFYAVDEAHCISEWGHDFRPEYRRIRTLINEIGVRPMIALTATATPKVQHDIQKTLCMQSAVVFKSSFNRDNLFYEVRPKTTNIDRDIIRFIKNHPGQSGIVYCLSRKKVDEISEMLRVNDIRALPYHAGLDTAVRAKHQDSFINEDTEVIVATIAFGMGIDKPDVRYVIHYDIPKSLEGYYQETGRAGRDGLPARCVCYYSRRDIQKLDKLLQTKSATEQEIGRHLLAEAAAYAETSTCRRKMLLHYFGESYPSDRCDNCDNCLTPHKEVEASQELAAVLEATEELDNYATTDYMVHILLGHSMPEIRSNGHDRLESYATLSDSTDKFLHLVIRQGLLGGYLTKGVESNSPLRLTLKGEQFLKTNETFKVIEDRDFSESDFVETDNTAPGAVDTQIYGILKDLRRDVGRSLSVPPYVIFSDTTLEAMAMMYPLTEEELLAIPGVGPGKIKRFGKKFLAVIKDYVDTNEVFRPTDIPVRMPTDPRKLKVYIIQSIDRKISLDVIAESKGLDFDEFLTELESIVEGGTHVDITYGLREIMDEERIEELDDYFRNTEEDDIESAFSELGSDFTDEEIRLGRIHFLSSMGN